MWSTVLDPPQGQSDLWPWIVTVLIAVICFLFPLLWRTKLKFHQESLSSKERIFTEMKSSKDSEISFLRKKVQVLEDLNTKLTIEVIAKYGMSAKAIDSSNKMIEKVISLLHEIKNK